MPFVLLVFGQLLLSGCDGAPKDLPKLGTVTGKVTLDGQPLPNAAIQFEAEKSRPSSAITDAQGKYELDFNGALKGAAIGNHKVRITTGKADQREKLPAKYHAQSQLTAVVKEGKNEINFDLTSK